MSLKISREDFSRSRLKKAVPVFLLLWLGGAVLALVYLHNLKSHLYAIEQEQVERLFDTYLAAKKKGNFTGRLSFQREHLPRDLLFARTVQGRDQLLVMGEQGEGLGFQGLVNFPPDRSGVWLELPLKDGGIEILTVMTRRFDNGVILQVGKDGSTGYKLYEQLRRNTVAMFFFSILIALPLSLFVIKFSLHSLTSTRQKIIDLAGNGGTGTELLPESGNGPELDRLYREINELLTQNRQLVSSMQQSLDNVAHDLRTPMTRLRSVAEYGLQAESDDRLRDALSDCLEESERVLSMLGIMMSVAEAETGTMRLEKRDIDIAKTLEQVVTLYEYVAEEKDIQVDFSSPGIVTALVDETRISRVWANLLDNAIKYGHEGGWVKIAADVEQEQVLITFEDNGIGISPNEQPRIWERLYRGDRSRSEKGLGLGLNYAKAVVEAHGGIISVDSRLHAGSRFIVKLPLTQVSTHEKSQTSGEWSESRTSGM
jgi:signal transduction histidine kinase